MKREVDPKQTTRARAFGLWIHSRMPMLTFFRTLDVANAVKYSRKRDLPFNMVMCWCVGKAASGIDEFYMLPEGDKLMQYDRLSVSVVVPTKSGGINSCEIPFSEDIETFYQDYMKLTRQVQETGQAHVLEGDYMEIGTSVLVEYEMDGGINQYTGSYNNPFMLWGRYHKKLFKTTLTVSFQFHHVQMDATHALRFLEYLQREIRALDA